jgi:hypothetical protein
LLHVCKGGLRQNVCAGNRKSDKHAERDSARHVA